MTGWLRDFIIRILTIPLGAIVSLFVTGWILTELQGVGYSGRTFFTYRVESLDRTPAWFIALLLLFVINGVWLFRLGVIGGHVRTSGNTFRRDWDFAVPLNGLRLFAVNLIAVPILLGIFMVVRALAL